jgi:hypothetical protein
MSQADLLTFLIKETTTQSKVTKAIVGVAGRGAVPLQGECNLYAAFLLGLNLVAGLQPRSVSVTGFRWWLPSNHNVYFCQPAF